MAYLEYYDGKKWVTLFPYDPERGVNLSLLWSFLHDEVSVVWS